MTTEAQTQAHARFRSDAGTADGTPTWFANEDTNYTADLSGGNLTARVRFSIQENSAASTSTNWILRLSKNGGAYNAVTTATSSVKSVDAGSSADETAIATRRLTAGTGSFINGLYDETGSTGAFQITANNHTEFEFGIQLVAADVAHNDTLDFRVYRSTTALTTYSVTPRITVSKSTPISVNVTGVSGTGSAGSLGAREPYQFGYSGISTGPISSFPISGSLYGDPGFATLTGVAGTGSAGTVTVTGKANVTLTGVAGTGSAGTPTVVGLANVTITGVSGTGSPGTPTVSGKANVTLTGASGTGAANTPTVVGLANITITGVAGTGSPGTPTVVGKANVSLTGVSGTGAPGTPTVVGKANVSLAGVSGTGSPGTPTVVGLANVSLTGVSGTGSPGTPTVVGLSNVTLTGVSGTGFAGTPTVIGVANVLLNGASGTGLVGTLVANAAGNVSVVLSGVEGVGVVGDITVTAITSTGTDNHFLPFLVTVGQMKCF